MSPPVKTPGTPPSLADLMLRYVNRPVDAGSLEAEASALGEVEPHEVAVGFRSDPRLAWDEGFSVLAALEMKDHKRLTAPADWPGLVARHESVAAQPMALAAYPQRVRDLTNLLQAVDLTGLRPSGGSQPASPSLRNWANKQVQKGDPTETLLAAAVLREANDLDQAEALLTNPRSQLPETFRPACINEEAALLWQKGRAEQALALWGTLPESAASFFNRGMALLFLEQIGKAREMLQKAVGLLPENAGWHHLGNLYLALAQMRS
jgi:tetratricopeptide (TPR) repeat protein